MLPRVIVHNAVSLDGRIDGFPAEIGLFYELAGYWQADAHLAGCDTLLQMESEIPDIGDADPRPIPPIDPQDPRALLVVPDSRGRLRRWRGLRQLPYWRGAVALCSRSTPQEYLENLVKWHVPYLIAGDDHVDLRAALELLNLHFHVRTVLVDSGGTLNGVLMRAGLVDEVSVLIHPYLIGGTSPRSFLRGPDPQEGQAPAMLRLIHMEQVREHLVWLRYELVKDGE